MKGYKKVTEKFDPTKRPANYPEIVKLYEIAAAHYYGGKNLAVIIEDYRIAETLVRKADRLKLTMPICKDDFKNFTNGVVYTLLANGLLQPSETTDEEGNVTTQPAKVEIVAPEEVKQYAFTEMNLWDFYRKVVTPKMLLDPNGLLVAMPYGDGLTDTATPVDVKLWYVPFKNIHYLSADEIVFFFGGYYYYISTSEYRRFVLKGNKVETDTWYYPHNLDYPVWSALGGIVADFDAMETSDIDYTETGDQFFMYESYISHAFGLATLAVRVFTDVEIMRQVHTHPYIEMESSPCQACNGQGCKGRETDFVDSCECPKDHSGEVKPSLPIGAVLYRQKSPFRDEKESSKPLLSFTAPDTSGIEWQGVYLDKCKNAVKEALNLYRNDQMQSGVAKQLDDNPRQMAIAEIAGNVYELMRKSLQWINDLRKISNTDIEIKLPEEWRVKV